MAQSRVLTTAVSKTIVDKSHFVRLRSRFQQDFDIVRLGVVETSKRRLSKQSDTGGLVSSTFDCVRRMRAAATHLGNDGDRDLELKAAQVFHAQLHRAEQFLPRVHRRSGAARCAAANYRVTRPAWGFRTAAQARNTGNFEQSARQAIGSAAETASPLFLILFFWSHLDVLCPSV